MKMIVGLGNPGPRYQHTRHNVGFMAVDGFARRLETDIINLKFKSLYTKKGEILLVKPQTYMNLSGEAVVPFYNYFKLESQDLMVVYDDMDIPLGQMRIKPKGSSGGHKGMESIITLLGRDDFPRLRIGVGRPNPTQEVVDYVLRIFERDEIPIISETLKEVLDALETWTKDGLDLAMNKYNQRA
ncbi:MAG: aminoacyl-tRNA hydrolase [Firmicutes bacterium]|nr:aminoacyl-tRNA hydrolase [Bacillota bacterium]